MRRFRISFPYHETFGAEYQQEVEGCQFTNGTVGFAWQPPYEGSRGIHWSDYGDAADICKGIVPYDLYWSDTYTFSWLDDAPVVLAAEQAREQDDCMERIRE